MIYKRIKIPKRIITKFIFLVFLLSIFFNIEANVITSIRPLGFIASAITHNITDVEILLPDTVSPHHYFLKPSDLKKIKKADLFIWIGPDMESFLRKLLVNFPNEKKITLMEESAIKKFLLKSNNIALLKNKSVYNNGNFYFSEDNIHSTYNVHIWLSPDIARITAKIIYDRLIILYPTYQNQLDLNLNKFYSELTQTDKYIAKMLKSVVDKEYFVFHDAYNYFEKHYHLSSLGYFTINPIIQPGAKKLYKIRRILTQKNAMCIFIEPQFKANVITTAIKGIDIKMGILDPLGSSIALNKNSYVEFLKVLSHQFKNCLDKN
ncbi:zinc ABC transporter substrate-binding protein ZnuA [Arsenophonus symbiont of Ornithomya chloropus]|uniref:zinc ABC transporter substrate-binding protein ZnuA n=1 Tax=Arsenophonus symbiont of Ornithomya chloropus TaxID=634121 RepID=UPI0032B129E7